MKTAMQELIELLELDEKHKEALPYLIDVIKDVYISKEKDMLNNMFEEGFESSYQHFVNCKDFFEFEDCYNRIYNQNK